MSILSDGSIRRLVNDRCLSISPYLDARVQPASYDVSLGVELRWPNGDMAQLLAHDDAFDLRPGVFLLGHTVETVRLPPDLVGMVNGKSSLGRRGLMIHSTAGFIDPGFFGTVVLEMTNVSADPIPLRVGMLIGQLVFQWLDAPAARPYGSPGLGSHYQGQRGAAPSAPPLG